LWSTGRCHTLVVTEAGRVVSFGCNILGRAGGKEPGVVRVWISNALFKAFLNLKFPFQNPVEF
jgi:alpha-tubulin suppressor-like RCC1 family protein